MIKKIQEKGCIFYFRMLVYKYRQNVTKNTKILNLKYINFEVYKYSRFINKQINLWIVVW